MIKKLINTILFYISAKFKPLKGLILTFLETLENLEDFHTEMV